MEYYINSQGLASPCIKEYEVSTTADLKKGTVLTLSNGKAVKATASGTVLGVLAEDYKTEKDTFNPRHGGGRVRVIVSSGAVYRQPCFQTTLTAVGTATKITVAGLTMPATANALKGGYVHLLKKAAGSENSDAEGSLRAISASSGNDLTLESGGTAAVGDVYEILPPAGFNCLALNSDSTGFEMAASASSIAQVVCCDKANRFCEIHFVKTYFA